MRDHGSQEAVYFRRGGPMQRVEVEGGFWPDLWGRVVDIGARQ